MVGGYHRHPLGTVDAGADRDAGCRLGPPTAEDVDLGIAKRGVGVVVGEPFQLDDCIRVAAFELAHHSAERRATGRHDEADMDSGLAGVVDPPDRVEQIAVGATDLAYEPLSTGREPHMVAGAVEQGAAELTFDGGDLLADPCLGDVQPLRCPPEMQFLGEDENNTNLVQLHGSSGCVRCQGSIPDTNRSLHGCPLFCRG
jgi:hypothetical protein